MATKDRTETERQAEQATEARPAASQPTAETETKHRLSPDVRAAYERSRRVHAGDYEYLANH